MATDDLDSARLVQALTQVLGWELSAQLGVKRDPDQIPPLLADTLLDYFDIAVRPGVDLPGRQA
jgi:hypothetical protein